MLGILVEAVLRVLIEVVFRILIKVTKKFGVSCWL